MTGRRGAAAAALLTFVALAAFVASFAVRPAPGRLLATDTEGPVAAAPGRLASMALPGGIGGAPATGSVTLRFAFEDARPLAGQPVLRAGTAASGATVRLVRLLGRAPALEVRVAPWPGGPLRAVLVPHVRPGRRYRLRLVLADSQTLTGYRDGHEVFSFRATQPTVGAVFRPLVVGAAVPAGAGGRRAGPSVTGVVLTFQVRAAPGSSTAAVALLTVAGLAAMALVFLGVVALAGAGPGALAGGGAGWAARAGRSGLAWCRRRPGPTAVVLLVAGGALLQVVTPPADAVGPRVGYERLAAASVPPGHEVRELLAPLPQVAPGRPAADEQLSFTLDLLAPPHPGGRPLLTTWLQGTGVAVSAGDGRLLVASVRTFAEQGGTFVLVRHAPLGRPLHVVVTAVRSRTVEATVNGRQVFAYTFASPVWAPEPTGLEAGAPGSAYRITRLVSTTELYGRPSPASSLLVVRLLQALGFLLVAAGAAMLASRLCGRLVPRLTRTGPLVRIAFGVAAAGIAVNLLVDALHLQTVPSPYTPRNTWLFASDARFSDFLQTFQMLRGLHPYGVEAGSYPPVGYFLVGPFAAMSPFAALLCFLAVFAGAFAWWCWRSFGGGRPVEAAAVLAVAFASYPVSFAVDRGNVDLLVALLLLLAVAGFEQHRDRLSAALVGVAAAAKVFPALYALAFLVRRRGWRQVVLAGVVAVAATAVGFLVLPGSVVANVDGLRRGLRGLELVYANGVQSTLDSTSLSSFFQAVGFAVGGTGGAHAVAVWVGRLVTPEEIVGGLWIAWYLWRRERSTWRALTIVTVGVLLLPQVSYAYDLVYVFLPLAVLVREAPTGPAPRRIAALFGLLLAPKAYLYLGTTFIDSGTLLNAPLLVALAAAVVAHGRAEARAAAGGTLTEPARRRSRAAAPVVTPSPVPRAPVPPVGS